MLFTVEHVFIVLDFMTHFSGIVNIRALELQWIASEMETI